MAIPWSDNFDDNSLDAALWVESTNSGSLVAEQNQRLECASSGDVSGFVRSYNKFVPQNTQIIVRVTKHANDAGVKLCTSLVTNTATDVYGEANWYNFQLISGALSPCKKVSGGSVAQVGGDQSVTAPYWMRIRIDGTTIYFDYSTQEAKPTLESEWTNISSEAWGLGTAITAEHYCYLAAYKTSTNGAPYFDYFSWEQFLSMPVKQYYFNNMRI